MDNIISLKMKKERTNRKRCPLYFLSLERNRCYATMKSNPSKYNPAKQDFIAKAISSAKGGSHPSKTDLIGVILC